MNEFMTFLIVFLGLNVLLLIRVGVVILWTHEAWRRMANESNHGPWSRAWWKYDARKWALRPKYWITWTIKQFLRRYRKEYNIP